MQKIKLYKIIELLDAELVQGKADIEITGIASITKAESGDITFLEKAALRKELATCKASVIVLRKEDVEFAAKNQCLLVVANPQVAFAKLTSLFVTYPEVKTGIHESAVIGENCSIPKSASVAANCVLGNNVTLGENVIIGAGSVIGNDVVIGNDSRLWSNVTIYYGVKIGERAIIHSGTIIGADGFGMANDSGKWVKIHQLGGVVIGNDVELGAHVCIDRGALRDTIIEDGVKLDNKVNIAHNVKVGAHTVMAGCTAIAGSTTVGEHCLFGGNVGIADHVNIVDGVILTARSGVGQDITKSGIYASAIPAMPATSWWRIFKRLLTINDMNKRLKKLEEKLND